jgi:hypothetical protein
MAQPSAVTGRVSIAMGCSAASRAVARKFRASREASTADEDRRVDVLEVRPEVVAPKPSLPSLSLANSTIRAGASGLNSSWRNVTRSLPRNMEMAN